MYDVIVVGGGAAGLMAAGRAAELGKKVLLIEKNKKTGEKLKITGGGRCNITNAEKDTRALLAHFGSSDKFLHSPFSQFGVEDTFNFFEERDLPLVLEAGKRAFPETHKAYDVWKVLDWYVKQGHVTVLTSSPVSRIKVSEGKIFAVLVGQKEYTANSYIFATGGVSHPETGSTGDGFPWLTKLGHSVQKPTPGIVPLSVPDAWVRSLSGISLEKVRITFFTNGTKSLTKTGKILCTHFGLSGPLIMNSASAVGDLLHAGIVTAEIDLFPTLDQGILEQHILSLFDANKNKMLKNVLKELLPPGTSQSILTLLTRELTPERTTNSITKEERKELSRLLKSLPLTISGLMGFDRAVVADGGVTLTEVDTKTMRSRIVPNLFIIGDLLSISRPSGGYSLQLCWTTGFVAGSSA
ncbi:MAG: aminoacetone oxidase family FAD-binding enzyme [Patescibacteria group bacterium]